MRFVALTPTADRPEALALCKRWLDAQTMKVDRWVVVNSGEQDVAPDGAEVHRLPTIREGSGSFIANLLRGVAALEDEKDALIFFIEDDDYYHPDYIAESAKRMGGRVVGGECMARYYNLTTQAYRQMGNTEHASLSSTVVRSDALPWLGVLVRAHPQATSVDIGLWRASQAKPWIGDNVVGMKGLPGRRGLGVGHSSHLRRQGFSHDPDFSKLREWVGDDAEAYIEMSHAQRGS